MKLLKYLFVIFILVPSHPTYAQVCSCGASATCLQIGCLHGITTSTIETFLQSETAAHINFLQDIWWKQGILPALKQSTAQQSAAIVHNAKIRSEISDVEAQAYAQNIIAENMAKAQSSFRVNEKHCEAVSLTQGHAEAEIVAAQAENAIYNAVMANITGGVGSPASLGPREALAARFNAYCENPDTAAANGALAAACNTSQPSAGGSSTDVSSLLNETTLDVDWADNVMTSDERLIIRQAEDICAGETLALIQERDFERNRTEALAAFSDYRSVEAKIGMCVMALSRSYAAKTPLPNGITNSQRSFLTEIGIDPDEFGSSLEAQQEVLFQLFTRTPDFDVSGGQDVQENILRLRNTVMNYHLISQFNAMEAGFMNELLISQILALELEDERDAIQARLDTL